MNFIKNFLPFKHYTAILEGKRNYRLFLATLFLAIVITIQPAFSIYKNILPSAQNLETKVLTLIDEVYPTELEIKIKNGQASTNVTEPYYITIREETLENLLNSKSKDQNTKSKLRLLAIDTKGKADQFEQYQAMALLTETSIVYYQDGKISVWPLREIKDLTVNKEFLTAKVTELNKGNRVGILINIVLVLLPLLIILGIFIVQLITFLLLALVVYLMVKINQLPTGFKNTLRYTTAIAFASSLVWNLSSFIPFLRNLLFAESVLSIIILGLAYTGINQLKNHE